MLQVCAQIWDTHTQFKFERDREIGEGLDRSRRRLTTTHGRMLEMASTELPDFGVGSQEEKKSFLADILIFVCT